ncbi:hypothetical protein LBMAG37_03690 [Anaerolineae bacterium]|nr:thiol-disulfide oxidoreductase ResA [Anaerolineaceae bacterium]GDX67215.1 hypothetical protein LBMAG37_03690 [Anaerolineae bacterium]
MDSSSGSNGALRALLAGGFVLGLLLAVALVGADEFNRLRTAATSARKTSSQPAAVAGPLVGDPAPDFELIEAGTGNKQRLSDYRGRPVLVNFWATWCAPCRTEMPALEKAAATYRNAGLQVLAVNFGESRSAVLAFAGELSLQLPLLLDSDGAVQDSYRVPGYPSSYFIDRQGRVAAVHLGILTEDQLSARLATILP